jgi:hypothetical protein
MDTVRWQNMQLADRFCREGNCEIADLLIVRPDPDGKLVFEFVMEKLMPLFNRAFADRGLTDIRQVWGITRRLPATAAGPSSENTHSSLENHKAHPPTIGGSTQTDQSKDPSSSASTNLIKEKTECAELEVTPTRCPDSPSPETTLVVAPNSSPAEAKLQAAFVRATPMERKNFLGWATSASTEEIIALKVSLKNESESDYYHQLKCDFCGTEFSKQVPTSILYNCETCINSFTQMISDNKNDVCDTCKNVGTFRSERGCPECNSGELIAINCAS